MRVEQAVADERERLEGTPVLGLPPEFAVGGVDRVEAAAVGPEQQVVVGTVDEVVGADRRCSAGRPRSRRPTRRRAELRGVVGVAHVEVVVGAERLRRGEPPRRHPAPVTGVGLVRGDALAGTTTAPSWTWGRSGVNDPVSSNQRRSPLALSTASRRPWRPTAKIASSATATGASMDCSEDASHSTSPDSASRAGDRRADRDVQFRALARRREAVHAAPDVVAPEQVVGRRLRRRRLGGGLRGGLGVRVRRRGAVRCERIGAGRADDASNPEADRAGRRNSRRSITRPPPAGRIRRRRRTVWRVRRPGSAKTAKTTIRTRGLATVSAGLSRVARTNALPRALAVTIAVSRVTHRCRRPVDRLSVAVASTDRE